MMLTLNMINEWKVGWRRGWRGYHSRLLSPTSLLRKLTPPSRLRAHPHGEKLQSRWYYEAWVLRTNLTEKAELPTQAFLFKILISNLILAHIISLFLKSLWSFSYFCSIFLGINKNILIQSLWNRKVWNLSSLKFFKNLSCHLTHARGCVVFSQLLNKRWLVVVARRGEREREMRVNFQLWGEDFSCRESTSKLIDSLSIIQHGDSQLRRMGRKILKREIII